MTPDTCDWCGRVTADGYWAQTYRQTRDSPAEYEWRCWDCDERDAGQAQAAIDRQIDDRLGK